MKTLDPETAAEERILAAENHHLHGCVRELGDMLAGLTTDVVVLVAALRRDTTVCLNCSRDLRVALEHVERRLP